MTNFLNVVMSLRAQKEAENYLTNGLTFNFPRKAHTVELVLSLKLYKIIALTTLLLLLLLLFEYECWTPKIVAETK
jgi:hypothetical protein